MNRVKELAYIGKTIAVKIDRPLKSKHPTYGFEYELNYGFVPNTIAGDGHEIDVYIIGVEEPIKEFEGVVRAVIIRNNDVENKLIVTLKAYQISKKEIKQKTRFQEKFFDIEIKFMTQTAQIAKRFREVILDGKWIANTNFKHQLSDLSWQQATTRVGSLNTIAALTFHIDYYTAGVLEVLEGGPLNIRDKFSFDVPAIQSQADWEVLQNKLFQDAERFAAALEQLPDSKLEEGFVDVKYGDYRRNIEGMIEHSYYHLGQIVLIKKMILASEGETA